ncbi:MAG: hypothetical protein E5Y30_20180 [Mesorhizobium sp.]|nr:MAG: hypothetical protein E5Y30_20180 [Mesorhizobium sp.]
MYDTETSERLARGDHGDDRSDASWTLYRTPSGVFFELLAGHDGVLEGFFPLTDLEARKFLERHANDRVEQYFGPAREATRSLFSRRTIIAAADVLENLTQAEISALLTDFGPSVYENIGGGSAKARMVELKQFIDRNPRHPVDNGLLENALVERAAARLPAVKPVYEWSKPTVEKPEFQRLRYGLEQDGFTVSDGILRRSLPTDIGLPQTDSELLLLLKQHRFEVSRGHLVQARDAHARGNWASENAAVELCKFVCAWGPNGKRCIPKLKQPLSCAGFAYGVRHSRPNEVRLGRRKGADGNDVVKRMHAATATTLL